jgi:hypothetical protein
MGGTVAAAALALMVLGGEPQAVGCWVLAAVALWLVGPRARPSVESAAIAQTSCGQPTGSPPGRRALGIVVLGLAASCVQWWPTWEAAATSTRSLHEQPQNLYHVLANVASGEAQPGEKDGIAALLAPPAPGSQADQALQFSQPPWHWLSLIVGNVWGTWNTVHARWDRHLSANDRVWNPTLYAGAATSVLALSLLGGGCLRIYRGLRIGRLGRRRLNRLRMAIARNDGEESRRQANRRHVVRWLVTMLVFFGLGSCGWYGGVWLWAELQHTWGGGGRTPSWGPQVGGLYWLLSISLPGFDQFRYPAKLWLLAGMAWSLLAACELDQVFSGVGTKKGGQTRAIRRLGLTATVVMIGLSIALAVLVSPAFVEAFFRQFQGVSPDPWLGILQLPQALLELHLAVIHSLVVVGLFSVWLWGTQRFGTKAGPAVTSWPTGFWLGMAVGLLTLGDVALSNGWLVQTVEHRVLSDRTIWETDSSPYRQPIPETRSLAQRRFIFNPQLMQQHRWVQMQQKWGMSWGIQPTEKWVWQAIYSMRATGMPQFHLPRGVPVVNAEQTLEPRGATLLRMAASQLAADGSSSGSGTTAWHSYLRSQGVRYWLNGAQRPADLDTAWGGLEWQTLPKTPPAVWLADHWSVIPPPDSRRPSVLTADLLKVWFDGQHFLDCPRRVIVDRSPFDPPVSATGKEETATADGVIDWQLDEQRKVADVRVNEPSILVWRQTYDPGWWCLLTDSQGNRQWHRTLPAQRYLTGVALPAGQFQAELVYCPRWYWVGGPLSVFSWCCLLVVGLRSVWTTRSP